MFIYILISNMHVCILSLGDKTLQIEIIRYWIMREYSFYASEYIIL